MDPQRVERIAEVFEGARVLDPAGRIRWLADACGDDEGLRAEVASLLAEHDADSTAFEPAAEADALRRWVNGHLSAADSPGPSHGSLAVPGFRILSVLGDGGQGAVYEAEQEHPRRTVALKVLLPQHAGDDFRRRFDREAETLARLHHPGIAVIHGSGAVQTQFGTLPWFAMELVRGLPLTQHAARESLATEARLALLIDVCDAVAHAHEKGVVHRDLKPSNILVDESGRPRVLDFGIARVIDPELTAVTLQTHTGQLMGTLAYMSPEQASGCPEDVDEQTDVFALGVLTFELLTGELPRDLAGRPIPEQLRLLADGDTTLLGSVDGSLRGDLETIVAKAMAYEKSRRYPSVTALAADLRRYLRSEPILARPSTVLYQMSRFVRRNRALSVSLLALLLALVAGLLVSLTQYLKSRTSEDEALWQSYVANLTAAGAQLDVGTGGVTAYLERCPEEYQDTWEWRYLWSRSDESLDAHVVSDGIVHQVALGPGGLLATGGGRELPGNYGARDYRVRIWDFDADSREVRPVRDLGPHRNAVRGLAFRPGGDELVSLSRALGDSVPGEVHLWRAGDGERLASLDCAARGVSPVAVAWLPESAAPEAAPRIAVASLEGVFLWEPEADRLVPLVPGDDVNALAVHPGAGATHLLVGHANGSVGIWELAEPEGPELLRSVNLFAHVDTDAERYSAGVSALAADPFGRRLLAGFEGGALVLVDMGSGEVERILDGHTRTVTAVRWSEDGQFAWSTSLDKTLRSWEFELAADGELLHAEDARVQHGHAGYVTSLAKVADRQLLITGAYDRTLRFWGEGSRTTVLRASEGLRSGLPYSLAFDVAGDMLAWRPDPDSLAVEDLTTGATHFSIPRFVVDNPAYAERSRGLILGVGFDPQGESLYSVQTHGGHLRRFNARTGALEATLGPELPAMLFVDFSHDGTRYAASVEVDGTWHAQVRSLATGDVEPGCSWPLDAPSDIVIFTPDDRQLVYALERSIIVRDVRSGVVESTMELPFDVYHLACSPDGELIAATTYDPEDRSLYILDRETAELSVFQGNVKPFSLAFMPDSSRIVTGNRDDGTVSLWDVERGLTLTLTDLEGTIQWVAVSPDGSRIAAVDSAGVHHVWDARPRRRLR